MKLSLKLAALLIAAGSPAFALIDSSSATVGGELSIALFAATGLVLTIVSDYARRTSPLSLPACKPRLTAADEAFENQAPVSSRSPFATRRASALIGS